MNQIKLDEIEPIKLIGRGNFSNVYEIMYNNKTYAYKEFKTTFYDFKTIDNIIKLSKQKIDKHYIVPNHIVYGNKKNMLGYLSKYDKELKTLKSIKSTSQLLDVLKDLKNRIEILHKEYKIIHNDIVKENILISKDLTSYMLDFDSSKKINEIPQNNEMLRLFIKEYIRNFGYDKNIDIYAFNLLCLTQIYNYPNFDMLFHDIITNKLTSKNKKVQNLYKELILEDNTNKKYSGEYIIDYI